MSFSKIRWAAVATAAIACTALAPVAGSTADTADRANPKIIRVGDDYFSPGSTRVGKGRLISWVWAGSNDNAHNVRLRRAPDGAVKRRFRSPTRRSGFRFSRRVNTPGRYVFVCSLHAPEMRHVINVRR
jgi:plastocyanin